MLNDEEEIHIPEALVSELTNRSFIEEAAVIRSLSVGGDVSAAGSIIGPEDFADSRFRVIYEAAIDLAANNSEVSLKTIVIHLEGNPEFATDREVRKYLRTNRNATAEDIKQNCLLLKKRSSRLKAATVANRMVSGLMESEKDNPALKIIMEARSDLNDLRLDTGLKRESALSITDKLLENWENPPPVIKTGIRSYDRLLGGGFIPGESYCFAGANKAGKTMAAGTISYNLNMDGVKHAYICLEMGAVQIEQRQVAIFGNVSTDMFMDERTKQSPELCSLLNSYKAHIAKNNNREFVDEALVRTSDIVAEMYRLKMEGHSGVIIDYFSLIHPDVGFRGTNNEHQDRLATIITSTAKSLGIWVLCIAQLNNNGDTYGSKALMRACSHVVALEKCNEAHRRSARWIRTVSARFTKSQDVGTEDDPGVEIHNNGSHIIDLKNGILND